MRRQQEREAAQPMVWSVTEAALMLGISRAFAYELIARGELAHVRLGKRVVVPRRAVERMLEFGAGAEPKDAA